MIGPGLASTLAQVAHIAGQLPNQASFGAAPCLSKGGQERGE